MTESKFTVVVPTTWESTAFTNFLADLVKFPLVDQIIIINNAPEKTPDALVLSHEKVRLIFLGENIHTNPAWNIGVKESRNKKICILKDNLIFDIKVFFHVDEILSAKTGVIGICPGDVNYGQPPFQNGSIKIKPWEGENIIGYGALMFVHKDSWIDVPDNLKVFYGDNWTFETLLWEGRTNYLITDLLYSVLDNPAAEAIKAEFLEKETAIYQSVFEEWRQRLFKNNRLKIEYDNACKVASNINEHLPTLKQYADRVGHVTEFGVSNGCSTRAFLNSNVTLRSYDIAHDPTVRELFDVAIGQNKDVQYIISDVTKVDIEPTDLLFIDSWHSYDQLKTELKLHSSKARKYLMFHDTQTFGTKDEGGQTQIGLLPAIIEFVIEHPEWRFALHKTNNNGLTVLERV